MLKYSGNVACRLTSLHFYCLLYHTGISIILNCHCLLMLFLLGHSGFTFVYL